MYEKVLVGVLAFTIILMFVMLVVFLFVRKRMNGITVDLSATEKERDEEKKELVRLHTLLDQRLEWGELLFNNTQDLVFVFAVDDSGLPGRFMQVNDMACRRLGHNREKLLGMTVLDVEDTPVPTSTLGYTRTELAMMSDEDIMERQNVTSSARHLMARILEERQIIYERVLVTRTGRRFPVEISARKFDLTGDPVVICTAHDITERRKVHRALRESEQRFQDFFAHSPIGVAMYDADRKLVNVNQSCVRMFGTPEQDEFSRFDMFDNPYISEEARRSLQRGENIDHEAVVDFEEIRRTGAFVTSRTGRAHFHILVHDLGLDQDYKPKGYLAQVQDVTRRRQAETALIDSERQLRQAQKMEAIGTLAGGIAHDFNNILTPILGYTEMVLLTGTKDESSNDYLQEVLKASHRAKELVNQILTFSRQTEREGHPIQVTPIIKEVLKQLKAVQGEKVEIRQDLRTEHDVVLAEPTQLHQVISNLCNNALHAMREDGGALEVLLTDFVLNERARSKYPHIEPGRYMRISVKDTGTGMDGPTAERAFEPFFTTKASGEGTGMGLAVVHGIVGSLKGAITIDTKLDVGTTFHVMLPVIEQMAEKEIERSTPIPGGSECVLFVDDEKDIVKMEAHVLTSLGYEPVVAGNGREGLRLFELNPEKFDLVITDQVMPEMTGTEMAEAILRIRPDIPIILCTGFSEAVSPQQAKTLGIREFMLKPIVMRHLAETIRTVLDTVPSA